MLKIVVFKTAFHPNVFFIELFLSYYNCNTYYISSLHFICPSSVNDSAAILSLKLFRSALVSNRFNRCLEEGFWLNKIGKLCNCNSVWEVYNAHLILNALHVPVIEKLTNLFSVGHLLVFQRILGFWGTYSQNILGYFVKLCVRLSWFKEISTLLH